MLSDAELQKAMREFDPKKPNPPLTPEERERAFQLFLEEVRNTDEATNAEAEAGIDQMLEHIYRSRTPPQDYRSHDQESDAA